MITEHELRQQVQQAKPTFFEAGGGVEHTDIVHLWPLPAGRLLFACRERWLYHNSASTIRLHVLDPRRGKLKTIGDVAGLDSAELAVAYALEWMRGLRDTDLPPIDHGMLHYLGELAWRMSDEQITAFEQHYGKFESCDWGTHENPNSLPDEHLWETLMSLGFSEEYIDLHLYQ